MIEFSEPLKNRVCYKFAATSVTNYIWYYEREEFPISGISLRQCEYHCKHINFNCERADWIPNASKTKGNCFIHISKPTNTSFVCSNCKEIGQFSIKCKTRMP